MKILVLSDSHSGLGFMRRCIRTVKPDAIVHLGDYYDDGQVIAEENPHITVHQVPGNCDRYRCVSDEPLILSYPVCGVRLYMTHGHLHHVKSGLFAFLRDAGKARAQVALYGHTHIPDCHREDDGMWVLNPGSCGSDGGSAGLIEKENEINCRILRLKDLEEWV